MVRNAWGRFFLALMACLLTVACMPRGGPTPKGGAGDVAESVKRVAVYQDGDGKTGISGQVLIKETGEPLDEGYVYIYPDAVSNLLGPSQFISQPTDAEGRYRLDVLPGAYYVVARKRMSGQASGPLSPGDYYSEHQRIISTVVEGKMALVDLEVVPMKAPMFFKKSVVEKKSDTGIRGLLLDAEGKPVPGSFAIAYTNKDMQRLPDFVSTLADGEGNFTIYFPEGGTYYVGGRVHAWDMPRPGELYGKFGGDDPQPVQVETGAFVDNIRIEMTPFTEEYKSGKSRRPY